MARPKPASTRTTMNKHDGKPSMSTLLNSSFLAVVGVTVLQMLSCYAPPIAPFDNPAYARVMVTLNEKSVTDTTVCDVTAQDTFRIGIEPVLPRFIHSVDVWSEGTTGSGFQLHYGPDSIPENTVVTPLTMLEPCTVSVRVRVIRTDSTSTGLSFEVRNNPAPVRILSQSPSMVEQEVRDSLTLFVNGSGSGPLRYQWLKDQKLLEGQDTDTLFLTNVTASDSGKYVCIVSSPWHSDTSATMLLKVIRNEKVNRGPVFVAGLTEQSYVINVGSTLLVPFRAFDPEGDSVAYSVEETTLPQRNSIVLTDSSFRWPSTSVDTGSYYAVIRAEDTHDSSLLRIDIRVADTTQPLQRPSWKSDTLHVTVEENELLDINLLDSCTTGNNSEISFTLLNSTLSGTPLSSAGRLTYFASFEDSGHYPLTAEITGGAWSDTGLIILTVKNVNRKPVFTDSLPRRLYRIDEGDSLAISFNAHDPDGDSVRVELVETTLPHKSTIVFTDSTLGWQSYTNDQGTYYLQLTVHDGQDSTHARIDIGVGPVNLPPRITIERISDGDALTVKEKDTLRFTVAATDPDHLDSVKLLRPKGLPSEVTGVAVVFDTVGGNFLLTAGFDVASRDTPTNLGTIDFLAEDNGVPKFTDTFSVSVTVMDSNRAPVVTSGVVSVSGDSTAEIVLHGNDPDGNALSWVIDVYPTHGTLTGTPPAMTYDPEQGFDGRDSLVFRVNDGLATSTSAVFVFTVLHANAAPVARDSLVEVDEDGSVSFDLPATDDKGIADYTIHSAPAHGTLSGGGSSRTYVPSKDYNGADTLIFSCRDDNGASSNTAVVSFVVAPVNDKPYFADLPEADTTVFGLPFRLNVNVADKDDAVTDLTLTLKSAPLGMKLVGSRIDWVVDLEEFYDGQVVKAVLQLSDDGGQSSEDSILITVEMHTWEKVVPASGEGIAAAGSNDVYRFISTSPGRLELQKLTRSGEEYQWEGMYSWDNNNDNATVIQSTACSQYYGFTYKMGVGLLEGFRIIRISDWTEEYSGSFSGDDVWGTSGVVGPIVLDECTPVIFGGTYNPGGQPPGAPPQNVTQVFYDDEFRTIDATRFIGANAVDRLADGRFLLLTDSKLYAYEPGMNTLTAKVMVGGPILESDKQIGDVVYIVDSENKLLKGSLNTVFEELAGNVKGLEMTSGTRGWCLLGSGYLHYTATGFATKVPENVDGLKSSVSEIIMSSNNRTLYAVVNGYLYRLVY